MKEADLVVQVYGTVGKEKLILIKPADEGASANAALSLSELSPRLIRLSDKKVTAVVLMNGTGIDYGVISNTAAALKGLGCRSVSALAMEWGMYFPVPDSVVSGASTSPSK